MFVRLTKKSLPLAVGLALGATLVATPASATTVVTESFETPVLPGQSIQYGPDAFGYNTNATGPVVIPNFNFMGFSGIISNGTLGVFNSTSDGNQAAFLQGYNGNGGEIDWMLSGLTAGHAYRLTFSSAGSLVVPAASFSVSGLGLTTTNFTPGATYSTYNLYFTPTASTGTISFTTPANPGNAASALDAFSISAVPEPASWALMLAGFGMLGFALRRRSNVRAQAMFA